MTTISRRSFLKAWCVGAVVAGGGRFFRRAEGAPLEHLADTELVRSTCSPNCTGACGYHALVDKGRIVTLIQAADYPEEPYNPRGCLRGLSTLNLIYGPDRLKQPLLRVGQRGEGKFRAVSWDEALDFAAEKLAAVMRRYGADSVAASIQVPGTGYVHKGALMRLASLYGWSVMHAYTMNGDLPAFWPMTFGVQTEELESLEWLNSRYIAVFGSNIAVTRVPDAKFLTLARERGAKLLMVDPNFTPTAAKADEWLQINPSTDAALALGIVYVLLEEKLYDAEFVKTYTDLPLLVRLDTRKKLLASEVRELHDLAQARKKTLPDYRELYVVFDVASQRFVMPDPETLERSFDPALEGEFEVELISGQRVRVAPVFALLAQKVHTEYSPERVAEIVAPDADRRREYAERIRRIAREMATTRPLHLIYGASNYQWYHGDLKGRALALIVVLTGNLGKPGAGISTYAGQYRIRWPLGAWWNFGERKNKWVPFLLWLNEEYRTSEEFKKYNRETPFPKNGVKAFVFGWHNPFDQHNMANRLRAWAQKGELELIMAVDFQMTTSCAWADVVFPAVSWYEKYELTATVLHPYLQLQQPAIQPLFESMPEIWIFKELAQRLAARLGDAVLARDAQTFYPNAADQQREEEARRQGRWSLDLARQLANKAALDAASLMLRTGGPLVQDITVEELKKGPVRLKLATPGHRQLVFWEQIHTKKPFPPPSHPAPLPKMARFVKSGRAEFYKDEDVFLELGETLPVHKPPFLDTEYRRDPDARQFRLAFVTRNALTRVHSTHSNNITMLELEEFRPKVWLHPRTAAARSIRDGDRVEVFNHRGRLIGYAQIDPGLHPDIVVFEQGWWSRYLAGTSYNALTFPWVKPSHVIYFVPGMWEPTTAWNEAACEVRLAPIPTAT